VYLPVVSADDDLDAVGALYVQRAVPDARDVVAALQALGKQVGIVSGGLQSTRRSQTYADYKRFVGDSRIVERDVVERP